MTVYIIKNNLLCKDSVNKYLFGIYYVPGTILGLGYIEVSQLFSAFKFFTF